MDYEGDSDEEEDEESAGDVVQPVHKRARMS